jgi:hypothetical protein
MSEQVTTDGPVELARNAAALAEAAAEHAESAAAAAERHRDAVFERAARAEQHKDLDMLREAGDQASAADAHANRAKRALGDAAKHLRFAEQYLSTVTGVLAAGGVADQAVAADDALATGAAVDRAKAAQQAAQQAADAAEAQARTASQGLDWVRYHLDGHCHHWKQRADFEPSATALAAPDAFRAATR